ncbi:hypothetical protein EYZ11_004350 [Aspergillus tanneri]|uniref:AMP-dependent synthetase/ligase domain-containing protein n=1 Tax=Aspergillus tanneri TaxID=1220188 RepID=A0A4S3JN69_9EURO|nr:hypothetical protein EYZ11_004350 [Aspergillus tanneri]
MIFSSTRSRLEIPKSLSIWEFFLDSEYSPLRRLHPEDLGAYINALTKERIRYDELKDYTTYLSTALVKKYGLKKGETVALFSPNTIFYPVAMLATVRVGKSPSHHVSPISN